MKGGEIPLQDKINLRKRAVIESVNDEQKKYVRLNIPDIVRLLISLQT